MVVSSLLDSFLTRFARTSLQRPQCTGISKELLDDLVAARAFPIELAQLMRFLLIENFGLRTAEAHGFLPLRELYRLHHATPLLLELFIACCDQLSRMGFNSEATATYYRAVEAVTLFPSSDPPDNEADIQEVSTTLLSSVVFTQFQVPAVRTAILPSKR
jgi:hypothetical protein